MKPFNGKPIWSEINTERYTIEPQGHYACSICGKRFEVEDVKAMEEHIENNH